MQLIEQVSQLHKMTSVQLAGAGAALTIIEQVVPVIQAYLPPAWQAFAFIAVVVARSIKQSGLVK